MLPLVFRLAPNSPPDDLSRHGRTVARLTGSDDRCMAALAEFFTLMQLLTRPSARANRVALTRCPPCGRHAQGSARHHRVQVKLTIAYNASITISSRTRPIARFAMRSMSRCGASAMAR
jgi:hypothetical protein